MRFCFGAASFLAATDMIADMNSRVDAMENDMGRLATHIEAIRRVSHTTGSALHSQRAALQNLVRIRDVLRRLQFLLQLPACLEASLRASRLDEAVRIYVNSAPVLSILAVLAATEQSPDRTGPDSPEGSVNATAGNVAPLGRSFTRLQGDIDRCVAELRMQVRAAVRQDPDGLAAASAGAESGSIPPLHWASQLLRLGEPADRVWPDALDAQRSVWVAVIQRINRAAGFGPSSGADPTHDTVQFAEEFLSFVERYHLLFPPVAADGGPLQAPAQAVRLNVAGTAS